MSSAQPPRETLRGAVLASLLVKYHLKISADIIQIYIERTLWLLQAVSEGLDRSMQGHNHLAKQKKKRKKNEEEAPRGCNTSCNSSPGDGPLLQPLFTAMFH